MPQIIVAADRGAAFGEGAVTFRERVNVSDFESEHFATQLVERLGWAVEDADVAERTREPRTQDVVAPSRPEMVEHEERAEQPSRDRVEQPSRDRAEEPSRDRAEEPSRDRIAAPA